MKLSTLALSFIIASFSLSTFAVQPVVTTTTPYVNNTVVHPVTNATIAKPGTPRVNGMSTVGRSGVNYHRNYHGNRATGVNRDINRVGRGVRNRDHRR